MVHFDFAMRLQSTENVLRVTERNLSPCGKDVDEHPTQCNLYKIVDSNNSGHISGIPVSYSSKIPGSSIFAIMPTFCDSLFYIL